MEKFEELSQEKQRRIIDAGMEMFGRYEYKKANTEDIAAKAGISKGLLFYYFKDKKSFYMYLFQYCVTIVTKTLDDEDFTKITDFFALMEFGAQKKMQIMVEHPFILDFICRAFSSRREAVSSDVAMELHSLMDTTFDRFFAHVDFSKFNNDVDPKQVYQMLVWMTEGYMHEKLSCQETLKLENIMRILKNGRSCLRRWHIRRSISKKTAYIISDTGQAYHRCIAVFYYIHMAIVR